MRSYGEIVTFLLLLAYLATGALVGHLRCHHLPATAAETGIAVVENSAAPLRQAVDVAQSLNAQPGRCCRCAAIPPTIISSSDGFLEHFVRLPATSPGVPHFRSAAVFARLAFARAPRAALAAPPSRRHLTCLRAVVLLI